MLANNDFVQDFATLAHRVIDGLVSGDPPSILIALSYLIIVCGTTWMSWKTAKIGMKCVYSCGKWAITPSQPSELYERLRTELYSSERDVVDDSDLRVGKVKYWCAPGKSKISRIYVCGAGPKGAEASQVDDLLSRRERKKLYKQATVIRDQVSKDVEQSKRKNRQMSALLALTSGPQEKMKKWCTDKSTPGNEESLKELYDKRAEEMSNGGVEKDLVRAIREERERFKETSNVENEARGGCGCVDCTAARSRRAPKL